MTILIPRLLIYYSATAKTDCKFCKVELLVLDIGGTLGNLNSARELRIEKVSEPLIIEDRGLIYKSINIL